MSDDENECFECGSEIIDGICEYCENKKSVIIPPGSLECTGQEINKKEGTVNYTFETVRPYSDDPKEGKIWNGL